MTAKEAAQRRARIDVKFKARRMASALIHLNVALGKLKEAGYFLADIELERDRLAENFRNTAAYAGWDSHGIEEIVGS